MQNALDVIDVGGVPTCRSVVDGSDPNCVPWNPFVPNGITQAQLDYLQAPGIQTGRISQEIYNGVVNGDLGIYGVKSPLGDRRHPGRVRLPSTGAMRCATSVDALQTANQLSGAGGAVIGISGATTVKELFMEARVPIAQDQAVRGEPLVRHRLPLLGLR